MALFNVMHAHSFGSSFTPPALASAPPAFKKLPANMEIEGLKNKQCCVCREHHVQITLVPCGHCCVCLTCVNTMHDKGNAKCPICRAVVQTAVPLHLPTSDTDKKDGEKEKPDVDMLDSLT